MDTDSLAHHEPDLALAGPEEDPDTPSPACAGRGITRREFVGAAMAGPVVLAAGPVLADAPSPEVDERAERPRPRGEPRSEVQFLVNGQEHSLRLDHRVTLLDALRERLGLPGTKKGCDHGQCGACTVLVDGRRGNACLTLAVSVSGLPITTVEGLAAGRSAPSDPGRLHPARRLPMRLLHARPDLLRPRPAARRHSAHQ